MKKIIFPLITFLLFLIVLVVGLALFFQSSVKVALKDAIEDYVGAPVDVAFADLNLKERKVLFQGVQISNPEEFPKGPLAKISKINIDLDLEAIKEKRIHITSLEVHCTEVHVMRDSEGRFNWFYLNAFRPQVGPKQQGHPVAAYLKNYFKDFEVKVDQLKLNLDKASYADFSRNIPFKKGLVLNVKDALYPEIPSLKEIITIIAWETLIRLDQDELKEPFALVEEKIESKLGTRESFLARWHQGKNSEQVINQSKA